MDRTSLEDSSEGMKSSVAHATSLPVEAGPSQLTDHTQRVHHVSELAEAVKELEAPEPFRGLDTICYYSGGELQE